MGRIKKGVMGRRCDVSDGAGMESTGRGRWRLFSKANQRKPMAFVVLTVTDNKAQQLISWLMDVVVSQMSASLM